MAQIDDFLSTLTSGGQALGQGGVDINQDYSRTSWQELTRGQGTAIFANLLRTMQQPGGYLSDMATNRNFAGLAASMGRSELTQQSDLRRALAASGVANPEAIIGEQRNDALQAIFELRSRLEQERLQNEAGMMTQLASVAAEEDQAARQGQLELNMWRRALKEQKKARKFGLIGSAIGLLGSAGAAPMSGGTSLFGKMLGGK